MPAAPATAQVFLYDPPYPSSPVAPDDPLIGLPLAGATAAESRAGMLWNLRAGLNVAALQCQFSPYLRTVDTYNALLAHHSTELAAAYRTLEGYFRRRHGATGPRRFDDYSTQTYNNFAALQAQFGFCQTASRIGKEALARRKGELHLLAAARMRELRASLSPVTDQLNFLRMPIRLSPVTLYPDCSRLEGRPRRRCDDELRSLQRPRR
ncbi:MAG: hypothetical protein ACT4OE_05520 [Sphingosinicella sp.]